MLQIEKDTKDWWWGDNTVHPDQKDKVILIHLAKPHVVITLKDIVSEEFGYFEYFKEQIVDIRFLYEEEESEADIDEIIMQAYNFLMLQEVADVEATYEADTQLLE